MSKLRNYAYSVIRQKKADEEERVAALVRELRADQTYYELECRKDGIRFEIARLRSLNEDFGSLKSEYNALCAKLETRLNELGHKRSELEIKYSCPLCKDTGAVNGEDCVCLKQALYDALRAECDNLVTAVDDLGKVDLSVIAEGDKKAYSFCIKKLTEFATDFPATKYSVMGLFGPVGTGKTYLASVAANALMRKGYSVLMLNSIQLNNLFLKYHTAPLESKEDVFEPLLTADLLLIDDLGVEPVLNNVTSVYLYSLLALREEPLLITSNLTPEKLRERYGDRVFSRLADTRRSFLMQLTGKDLRFRK